jgi:hypothetical protein
MSSAASTKIFGMRVGLDPKYLVAVLIAVAAILFWYNSRSTDDAPPGLHPAVSSAPPPAIPPDVTSAHKVPGASAPGSALSGRGITAGATARRNQKGNDHNTLRLRAIDPTHGDVDPTLRLDLLARLQSIGQGNTSRNLFEMGAAPAPGMDAQGQPIKHVIIPPKPIPQPPQVFNGANDPMADINIPLKYYGFSKPIGQGQANRGFFLDDQNNILVASEGELVKQQFLVVELNARSARLEDTHMKKGKSLTIVPEAKDGSVAEGSGPEGAVVTQVAPEDGGGP